MRGARFVYILAIAFCQPSFAEGQAYALVAAMGDRFMAMHEVQQIGSRLPPFRKRPLEVKDDAINKIVLASLDEAVVKLHPDAQRVYVTVKLSNRAQDRVRSIEENAFDEAIAAIRDMPDRAKWYRIVLVTPTNRVQNKEGLASDTQGMGLFQQGLCQSDNRQGEREGISDCDRRQVHSGVEVETPNGKKATMARYVAPFYFAKVWVIDPASLQVIDTEVIHDHVKLNDPDSNDMDMAKVVPQHYLAQRIVQQVETSTVEAVKRTELKGQVEVKEKGEVAPPKKQ